MNIFTTEINEAYAYVLIGILVIVMKITNLVSIDWFWIILTLLFPVLLTVFVFILISIFGIFFNKQTNNKIEDDED